MNTPTEPAGILLVDKPRGITSFDVIRQLRRSTGIRKMGHTGTLDPMATGLMVMLIGKATKRAAELVKLDKVYRAEVTLGANSTTGDAEGELAPVSSIKPSRKDVDTVCHSFIGNITQIPPQYSAIKINGVAAYKRMRRGEQVVIPARQVTIYDLQVLEYSYPKLTLQIHVSSGTYIRTLAQDIGAQLGTGAHLTALRRLTVGPYKIDNALVLDGIDNTSLSAHLMK